MANLSDSGATRAKADKPATSKPTAALDFVDRDAPPTAAELNQSANPFQDKVNELARTEKAASFDAPVDEADSLVNQFRAACANIKKGGRVRREVIKGDDSHVRIHIWVTEKRAKKTK